MCGIAGILDFDAAPIDENVLHAACAAMRHRGPDDQGTFIDPEPQVAAGLAAVRLAVIDPTPAGHQPFLYDDDRYALVFNGELYNYCQLHAELATQGRVFRTETDTEVVAAACAHWGAGALERMNGMWALAFFDRNRRSGFLARDRFGIKPLLVARQDKRLYFASEMRALAALGDWNRTIDRRALLHYLHFGYFSAPACIYSHARRVEPAHYLAFDSSGLGDAVRYYDPVARAAEIEIFDQADACRRIRNALLESVARRRVADVPLGTFLSGGLDSSIIALHLAQCSPAPIASFAIGYKDQPVYDETQFARIMAERLGSEHHELRLGFDEVIETLPGVLDSMGEPFFDSSILPTAVVSRLARSHVTVCLSGDGGDELFGGYHRYLGHESIESYEGTPALLRRGIVEPLLRRAGASKSSRVADRVRQFRKLLRGTGLPIPERHLAWSQILSPDATSILRDGADDTLESVRRELARLTAGMPEADPINRILAFDLQYSLPSDMLHKVDLASMMHSLEVRVPFLDQQVVETALACPTSWKVSKGLRKRLLIQAYRGRLPDEILDRPKMGFELPIGEFLRAPLRDMFHDVVTRDCVESLELLDFDAIQDTYTAHCSRRNEHADLLFALLSLCWWKQHAHCR